MRDRIREIQDQAYGSGVLTTLDSMQALSLHTVASGLGLGAIFYQAVKERRVLVMVVVVVGLKGTKQLRLCSAQTLSKISEHEQRKKRMKAKSNKSEKKKLE